MIEDATKGGKDLIQLKNKRLMNEIIKAVMKNGKIGLSQKELSEMVNMNRETLRRYMNTLMNHGLIKRYSEKGKYYINPLYLGRSYIGGIAFSSHFLNEILGEDNIAPKFKRRMISTDYYSNDLKENNTFGIMFDGTEENISKKVLDNIFKDEVNKLQKSIFEFANQIGAYHIFVYLVTLEKYHVDKNISEKLTPEDIEWLQNALSSFIIDSYYKFRDKVSNYELNEDQKNKISQYIKDNKLQTTKLEKIIHAEMSLASLYPIIYTILQQFDIKIQDDNMIMKNDLIDYAGKIE
ncbi:winged helix-turn-helix transcriptional regulator [Candidatus Nitrosocosmicus agrestis]|jgi:DNA-binding Lrp family transcriptional regulator|uniref:winged helix-turn-helix transcriptional regulator n=1 Tax=Candidatus Nitrosocosmicus agrestis TaxID=2563600 RepID=UPI00122E8B08|nr:winged helix-turn-helix transcriptional regulator [Candidatus Nitrosocosmicus sp. SS]KAA2283748.1 winged helix-turn-helix transcriptional regulator [Candidatus Nitrosocosmicus sp. SS]KAF0870124.1 winged helix-turn-helix transcriptional regulator [Candidatus Nitrosocosmicus sp. SS]